MPCADAELCAVCYWERVVERAKRLKLYGAVEIAEKRLDEAYDSLDFAERQYVY